MFGKTDRKADIVVAYRWTETREALLTRIWDEIGDVGTRRSGFSGLATLATVGLAGGPELRQVVLRRADRAGGWVEVFTDTTTPKVAEIRANPLVSLLLWHAADALQIRLRGRVVIAEGAAVRDDWQAMTEAQRGNYGTRPPPGTPIAENGAFERVPDPARLAVLTITLNDIDAVHLARPHDLRAQYTQADDWQGQWVAP